MSDTITIIGNVATQPELKHTAGGVAITTFRVASGQRRFDRATGAWVDGGTNWYSVSTFRGLAENTQRSIHKGDRVVLTGRLRLRAWDTGVKSGTTAEIDAEAIGHDLLWGTTVFERSSRTAATAPADPETAWDQDDASGSSQQDGAEPTPPVQAGDWAAVVSAPDDARALTEQAVQTPF